MNKPDIPKEVIEALECCKQYFAKHKIKSAVVVMVDKALEKIKP